MDEKTPLPASTAAAGIKGSGEAPKLNGESLRIAIVQARWNAPITSHLSSTCHAELQALGVKPHNIHHTTVPGAWELPFAVSRLLSPLSGTFGAQPLSTEWNEKAERTYDAVIAIGCLIKGETMHFEYIANAVSEGLMRVGLERGVPVVFGVLTVLGEEQAQARMGLGREWAAVGVEMGGGLRRGNKI